MIDETGHKYGKLTVLKRGENDNNGKVRWYCQCECGNIILTRGTDLRRGKVKTCGCSSIKSEQSLIGKKFGKLLVLEYAGRSSQNKIQYRCKCDCGKETVVIGAHLKNGNTKSCGCLQKEINRKVNGKDELGHIYGKLKVIAFDGSKDGNLWWKCQCTCGNIISVNGVFLRNGNTSSCGCTKSAGEEEIIKILIQNTMKYLMHV